MADRAGSHEMSFHFAAIGIARDEPKLKSGRVMPLGCLVIVETGLQSVIIVYSYSTCSSEAAIDAGRPAGRIGG